ncbi:MAG: ParB/RepB/Spo0J family partition protein [Candidatus Omnitrophica bacterium]|nr:ParB/RepB/Spo0J family partition protein [Candidatus Omnitrophota bacterium]
MALGRGLSALIPDKEKTTEQAVEIAPVVSNSVQMELEVKDIADNRFQPRQAYDESRLDELAASIKEKGLIQPIVVRKSANGFEVVAGERRLRAARKLGLARIPVVVRDVSDKDAMVLALVENIQREELNPVEKAETYRRLIEEFGFNQEAVAQAVGKDRVTIANLLRLLKLPKEILQGVFEGQISEGHARAILSVENDNAKMLLYLETVKKGFSVREVEERAKAASPAGKKGARKNGVKSRDAEVLKLEDELRQVFGTKVAVVNSRNNKGRVVIEYYSLNDLDRILGVIRK